MKLLESVSAVVPEQKIVACLLSFSHPDGRGKALFFTRFGFDSTHWQILAEALRQQAATYDVAKLDQTPFGTRYVVEGHLETPDGRNPLIRSVWFIATGETIPRSHLINTLTTLKNLIAPRVDTRHCYL